MNTFAVVIPASPWKTANQAPQVSEGRGGSSNQKSHECLVAGETIEGKEQPTSEGERFSEIVTPHLHGRVHLSRSGGYHFELASGLTLCKDRGIVRVGLHRVKLGLFRPYVVVSEKARESVVGRRICVVVTGAGIRFVDVIRRRRPVDSDTRLPNPGR